MLYKVIGLMSGSSLDGLDIAHVQLEEVRGQWNYQILNAECLPYSDKWVRDLHMAADMSVADLLRLHTAYGHYLGECVNTFIASRGLDHQVHFIASHGHTVFHEPARHTTFQVGDGAALAAVTGLPVISDLRAMDVALGGQGAPIVPVGDKLLFGGFGYLLNIGGIANITIQQAGIAFDVCPANQVFNIIAAREGLAMDEGGAIAACGKVLPEILDELDELAYYQQAPPRSLSNEEARNMVFPSLLESPHSNSDLMRTMAAHVARQVAASVARFPHSDASAQMLVTGGGAFNTFLVRQITEAVAPYRVEVVVPEPDVVKYKEALVMALIGTLRWRQEVNVFSSVTGASRDSVGGALWLG
jgi:anhydro-N-acetylmuramic acid kinase